MRVFLLSFGGGASIRVSGGCGPCGPGRTGGLRRILALGNSVCIYGLVCIGILTVRTHYILECVYTYNAPRGRRGFTAGERDDGNSVYICIYINTRSCTHEY